MTEALNWEKRNNPLSADLGVHTEYHGPRCSDLETGWSLQRHWVGASKVTSQVGIKGQHSDHVCVGHLIPFSVRVSGAHLFLHSCILYIFCGKHHFEMFSKHVLLSAAKVSILPLKNFILKHLLCVPTKRELGASGPWKAMTKKDLGAFIEKL